MANQRRAGGGYRRGAGAQEENLHRRSNLCDHLEDAEYKDAGRSWGYPLPDFGVVHSPDVAVFRASESDGYAFLPEVEYYSFVSAAAGVLAARAASLSASVAAFLTRRRADYRPELIEREVPVVASDSQSTFGVSFELRLAPKFEDRMRQRILAVLGTAVQHGHDAIVLSAFGCGAFGNPPRHVAQLFRETIKQHGFHYQFRFIYFAIFDDHNSHKKHNPDGNFQPFRDVFYGSKK